MKNNKDATVLSKAQQQAIDFSPGGTLVVRGRTGSGKTTVLLRRARRLAEYGSVCVLVPFRVLMMQYQAKVDIDCFDTVSPSLRPVTILTIHEMVRTCPIFSTAPTIILDDALKDILADLAKMQGKSFLVTSPNVIEALSSAFIGDFVLLGDLLQCGREDAVRFHERFKQFLVQNSCVPLSLIDPMLLWLIDSGSIERWDYVIVDGAEDFPSNLLARLPKLVAKGLTIAAISSRQQALPAIIEPAQEIILGDDYLGVIAAVGLTANIGETATAIGRIATIACTTFSTASIATISEIGSIASGEVTGADSLTSPGNFSLENSCATHSRKTTFGILTLTRAYCSEIEERIASQLASIPQEAEDKVDVQIMTILSSQGLTFDYAIFLLHSEPPEEGLAKNILRVGITRSTRVTKILCVGEAGRLWIPYLMAAGILK